MIIITLTRVTRFNEKWPVKNDGSQVTFYARTKNGCLFQKSMKACHQAIQKTGFTHLDTLHRDEMVSIINNRDRNYRQN
jgi:hypothetical protein